jgi:hypothetical protein
MNEITPSTRRAFLRALTAAGGLAAAPAATAQSAAEKAHAGAMALLKPGTEKIAILIYPGFTALDAIGPQHMLAGMTGASVKFIAASLDPVKTDSGYHITPQLTYDQCPEPLDLLLIPGGTSKEAPQAFAEPPGDQARRLFAFVDVVAGLAVDGFFEVAHTGSVLGLDLSSRHR